MNEQLLDTLSDIADEYASTIGSGEHFVLDRREHYPDKLPFSPQPFSADSSTVPSSDSSLRIPPELAAAIKDDIQRQHSVPNDASADPLDILASQLDALTIANAEQDFPLSSTDESQPTSPNTPVSATTEEAVSSEDTPTVPPRKRRRQTIVLLLLSVVGGAAGIFFLLPYIAQISTTIQSEKSDLPITERQSTLTKRFPRQISSSQQESLRHSESAKTVPLVKADTTIATSAEGDESSQPRRATATASPTRVKERSPTLLPNRVRTQPELMVVSPPDIEYPSGAGKFSIQACSTPSYAEALRWKERLERHGTYPVSIIEHRIRNNTYYRVRVGSFSSQVQAQQAVSALGLNPASIWIVRIE